MKKNLKFIGIFTFFIFVSAYLGLFFLPTPALLEPYSFSRAVYDDQHQLLRLTLSKDDKYRLFTPLNTIPQQLIDATLLQEDQYFFLHKGINPFALIKAVWSTYITRSHKIGASTITMQLARIRFEINSKTSLGKVEQILRALQLEAHYNKKELLEAYLNLAPYGGNIEGVGAASLIYFHQSIEQLSLPQALTLSIIPQNPNKRTPNNNELKKIGDALFARWIEKYPEDRNKKIMFDLPLVMYPIKQLPFRVPHLVNMVLKNNINEQELITTLDSRIQLIVERITLRYLTRKKNLGVYNSSILLIDTRDMSIKSMLGSANFFDKKISGQINGVETKRSPGSTLKPFIYGLALDQGLIHPSTVLKDVPHSFNGYNPENFDYDFMGPIKAKDALVLSRNIPAIYLSNQLKNPSLHQLLEQTQISHLKPESFYGLSLNLGSVELTMHELVSLYAMLVNEGVWYPLHALKKKDKREGARLLSREASFLVLDMLQNNSNYDFGYKNGVSIPVSWKTGTSSGYRDAWTIGAFGPYVLGVWLGNFDNTANPAFIGKDLAAPLFFELVNGIQQEHGPIVQLNKHPETMNLKKVEVCKASGLLPTRYCSNREWTWFIPGKSPIKTDTIFREVAINNKTGLRTCHIDEFTRFETFEFWSSDLLRIFRRAGIQRHTPPFFEADCALSSQNGVNPQISSPQQGISYVIRINSTSTNTIPLTAVSDAGVAHLYWFINETFIAKTSSDESYLWEAKPGKFTIRVVDDRGLSDARDINIEVTG